MEKVNRKVNGKRHWKKSNGKMSIEKKSMRKFNGKLQWKKSQWKKDTYKTLLNKEKLG